MALISLARIIFPSSAKLYGQYKYPLVSQWEFVSMAIANPKAQINRHISVTYMKDFDIQIRRPKT